MPLYFAYGSNMDVAAMQARCPSSKVLRPARLVRHRFFIMRQGYASVMRHPRGEVHGLLWDLALADVRPLDRYEDIAGGLYTKSVQPVLTGAGAKRALIYYGASLEPGRPLPGYLEGIIRAAEAAQLPAAYLRDLKRFLPHGAHEEGPTAEPALDPCAQTARVRPRFATPFDARD
ncbi:gamma-glutamylcyclotransferase family protein [Methylovirgula sp. 4M-Z18]|uniref:gamma-glutamylcyclotransferase family protein n=1 Tax=Methylovirgula sp. 4M-Z18 TaxID=2293567 RepID=UPI000E2E97B3|nr:gamma-glutamylcyclotransferase [Methylovirgula sp. 4M-Z18]